MILFDSLIAIKFQIEAMNIGLNITYADIFSYPTIKQLSDQQVYFVKMQLNL